MQGYSKEEIEKLSACGAQISSSQCEVMPIVELIQLLETGWVLYDTRPTSDKDIKLLTLAKINPTAQ